MSIQTSLPPRRGMRVACVLGAILFGSDRVDARGDGDSREAARARHEQYSRTRVTGRVLDASGAPAPGVRLSTFWSFRAGVPEPKSPATTAEDGWFDARFDTWFDPFALVAYSTDGSSSGLVVVDKDASNDLTIRLAPTVRVRGRVTCAELASTPEWINSYWMQAGDFVIESESTDGSIDVRLAPGTWHWEVYDETISTVGDRVDLDGGSGLEVDLGEIDLPATFIRRHRGKVLPEWTVTEARGLPPGRTRLEDFRGRWIVLEFWGHW